MSGLKTEQILGYGGKFCVTCWYPRLVNLPFLINLINIKCILISHSGQTGFDVQFSLKLYFPYIHRQRDRHPGKTDRQTGLGIDR